MRLTIRHFLSTFDRVSLIYIIVSPVFFIFILGYGIGGIIPDFELGGTKVSYTLFLAAGIIPYAVINSGMASGMLLWIDRKNGMFEQILMGPFTRTQYIASLIISTIFAGLVSAGVVFVLALPVIAGATLTLAGFVYAGLTIVLGSLFFGSLAIILSIRVKSSESFQLLINFLFFLLVFTSSVFYPVEKAPSVIQVVSLINPLTYIVDIFRIGMFGLITPLFTLELIVLIAESFGMFALAIVMFRRLKV